MYKYGENRINRKTECSANIGASTGYPCGLNDFLMRGISEYLPFKEVTLAESRRARLVWFPFKEQTRSIVSSKI